jgi:asparagine synthase (glutamine-hydrolysing)
MCGFYGEINNNQLSVNSLKDGLSQIYYRGPDSDDTFIQKNVGIGFNRLSIIDIDERASQPMISLDNKYVIVFNGEIYNYKELKRNLENKGFLFRTKSDTEVVLTAYIYYGKGFLEIINGMFAIAIYNREDETIFMARDRSGQKPFVYYFENNKFFFASEIKSILQNTQIDRSLSQDGLYQYLALGYVIAPHTIYKNVYKLKPGHYIEFNTLSKINRVEQIKYWEVNFCEVNTSKSLNEYKEELHELLIDSIKIRLNSDVPLAVFLSGGLDSSIISSLIVKNKLSNINAFTVDFDDNRMSEIETVNSFINKYPQINHQTLNLKVSDMLKDFEVLDLLDEPFSDSSIIPTYWISKLVKESGYTVAIGGDGGDELLGGYYKTKPFESYDFWFKYTNSSLRSILKKSFSKVLKSNQKSHIERLGLSQIETYWFIRSNMQTYKSCNLFNGKLESLIHEDRYPICNYNKIDTFSLFETCDFKYRLAEGYLTKVDKASMYNSLEVRNPFLDYRIIELLMKMPKSYKINKNQTKYILREIAQDKNLLNSQILEQRKMGFSIPLKNWVINDLQAIIKNTVYSSVLMKYINESEFNNLFILGNVGTMHNSYIEIIWRIFILAKVLNKYKIENIF